MKNSFYTHVALSGDNILFRGIENGRRVSKKIRYSPTLFLKSPRQSKYKTIHGLCVEPLKFNSMSECRGYIKTYEGVHDYTIYGNQRYEYCFIADNYEGEVHWDANDLLIANIDIEVGSENGFPEPKTASEEITAITLKLKNHYHVFGCGEYQNSRSDVTYYKCSDEYELIKEFLVLWTDDYPDIVTGWNCKFFDFPYIINRIKKLFGENVAKKLSPWSRINDREVVIFGRPQQTYEMCGTVILDYMELYRKFSPVGQSQESYKLNHIAHNEVGEKKISYDEYDNLFQLYRLDYQKFIDYNIRDVELVDKIDDKLKLIELSLTLAYEAKANYDDVLAQTRMWDALIFNKLKKDYIVFPPQERHTKTHAYEGAYVKDPIIGLHKFVASFDLESLYPHLVIQYSISPETLVEKETIDKRIFELEKSINNHKE
jgi:DNA polymerase elongation subunit (family B)